jgi:putative chitinase
MGPNKKPKRDAKGALIPTKVALSIEKKPELIANMVYSSRMGNGPPQSGEGWKYRGRGLKQLTGKDNYKRCGDALNLDLVNNPDLLLEPMPAARSAGWFWKVNTLSPLADASDIKGMTKKINGGFIGLEARQALFDKIMAAIKG